jgi:hypothetical protein
VTALARVHSAWLAFADATPQIIEDESKAMQAPEWPTLVQACSNARDTLLVRGKLPEAE